MLGSLRLHYTIDQNRGNTLFLPKLVSILFFSRHRTKGSAMRGNAKKHVAGGRRTLPGRREHVVLRVPVRAEVLHRRHVVLVLDQRVLVEVEDVLELLANLEAGLGF